jgi:hypothetical protein
MHLHAQEALVDPHHQPQKVHRVPVRQLRQGAKAEVKIAVQEAANKPFSVCINQKGRFQATFLIMQTFSLHLILQNLQHAFRESP